MHLKAIGVLLLLLNIAVFAEDVKISGKVTNQSGKPISGAVITLKGQDLKATTNAQGEYILDNSDIAIRPLSNLVHVEDISINNSELRINLAQAALVKIDIYDMSGNLFKSELNQNVSAGEYKYNFNKYEFAPGMKAVRVIVGSQNITFRLFQSSDNKNVTSFQSPKTVSGTRSTLAKIQSAVDYLTVSAPNCTTKVVPVSSFKQTLNITMDTLPRFSFFVTSLKALRLLSNNPNGFGGDLRFGKTGQGAGLLGADSICSCVAEMSMKGARFKQWRAFLSVAKGPEGTQVNAIDRIGMGPWYDRLGRLLANNQTELISDRPANADMAIKNDFPNEDGVPNHQPDPAKEKVDNHMFVTGSDTRGKLYRATATCDDWTSIQSGSQPRAGLSWPQLFSSGGKSNWISAMDCAGCQPGIDSTEASMGGVPGVTTIGNGGGYGGFYCFGLNP